MIYAAIVTWNRVAALRRLLENPAFWIGLAKTGAAEVVILDQGSTDGTLDYVVSKNCHYLPGRYNFGAGGGRQRIVDYLLGKGLRADDVVIFVDDDIQVTGEQWAVQLVEPIRNGWADVTGIYGRRVTADWLTEPSDTPDYVGGVMAASGDVCKECTYDPAFYPAYWEDVDWCWQARQLGYDLVAIPDAELHHDSVSDKTLAAQLVATNRVKFIQKWEGKRQ